MGENKRRFDVVIYGASGFTGKQVVRYLPEVCRTERCEITWAVAGRNAKKLEETLAEVGKELQESFADVEVIVADSNDEASLRRMAARARVVVACAGPYRDVGPPVVRACIASGAHYVDVTAEAQFPERMQLDHFAEASQKGVYVVTSCGLDSIPVDLGVAFVQQKFRGTLNSVETYHDVSPEQGQGRWSPGPAINLGTWHSLVCVLEDYKQLREIRSQLLGAKTEDPRPQLKFRRLPHRPPNGVGWGATFPNTDAAVVRRSQRHFHQTTGLRPVQIRTYLQVQKFWYLFLLVTGGLSWVLFSKFKCGCRLLRNHPRFFTLGFFDSNPTAEAAADIVFSVWLKGDGWKDTTVKNENCDRPTDGSILARCKGRNGYRATAVCALSSALTLLTDGESLPGNGGVLTPAAAFRNTRIFERLGRNGVEFEVVEES